MKVSVNIIKLYNFNAIKIKLSVYFRKLLWLAEMVWLCALYGSFRSFRLSHSQSQSVSLFLYFVCQFFDVGGGVRVFAAVIMMVYSGEVGGPLYVVFGTMSVKQGRNYFYYKTYKHAHTHTYRSCSLQLY